MDAYAYIDRGGVFASAQTGNVVLLGVHLVDGHWDQAERHLPPILAFFFGALLTRMVVDSWRRPAGRAVAGCLMFEAVGLLILGVLGKRLPDAAATVVISIFAAVQSASFAKVGTWGYNSAMTTGNLRSMARMASAALLDIERKKSVTGTVVFGLLCLSFLVGAIGGGIITSRLGSYAIGACSVLVVAAIICLRSGIATGPRQSFSCGEG